MRLISPTSVKPAWYLDVPKEASWSSQLLQRYKDTEDIVVKVGNVSNPKHTKFAINTLANLYIIYDMITSIQDKCSIDDSLKCVDKIRFRYHEIKRNKKSTILKWLSPDNVMMDVLGKLSDDSTLVGFLFQNTCGTCDPDRIFTLACKRNSFNVAKIIYSNYKIDLKFREYSSLYYAGMNNNKEMFEWLYTHNPLIYTKRVLVDLFHKLLDGGNVMSVDFMYNLDNFKGYIPDKKTLIEKAIVNNHISLVKWIHQTLPNYKNIDINYNHTFIKFCAMDDIDAVKCMSETNLIDIHDHTLITEAITFINNGYVKCNRVLSWFKGL